MLKLSGKLILMVLVLCFCWSFSCFAADFSPFEYLGKTEQELLALAGEPDYKGTINAPIPNGQRATFPRWEYKETLANGFEYIVYYTLNDQKVVGVWYTAPTGDERNCYYMEPDEFEFINLLGKTHAEVLDSAVLPQNHSVPYPGDLGEMDYYFKRADGINVFVDLQLENGKVSTVRFYYIDFANNADWDLQACGESVFNKMAPLLKNVTWSAGEDVGYGWRMVVYCGVSETLGVSFKMHDDDEMGRGLELYVVAPAPESPFASAMWQECRLDIINNWRENVQTNDFAAIIAMFGGLQGGDIEKLKTLLK